jgi:hypothetical protein
MPSKKRSSVIIIFNQIKKKIEASEFLKQDAVLIKIANQLREAADAANDDLPF